MIFSINVQIVFFDHHLLLRRTKRFKFATDFDQLIPKSVTLPVTPKHFTLRKMLSHYIKTEATVKPFFINLPHNFIFYGLIFIGEAALSNSFTLIILTGFGFPEISAYDDHGYHAFRMLPKIHMRSAHICSSREVWHRFHHPL